MSYAFWFVPGPIKVFIGPAGRRFFIFLLQFIVEDEIRLLELIPEELGDTLSSISLAIEKVPP